MHRVFLLALFVALAAAAGYCALGRASTLALACGGLAVAALAGLLEPRIDYGRRRRP